MKIIYLSVIFMLIEHIPNTVCAIRCYRCLVAPTYNDDETTGLCKDFDYSDRFIVDCPFSTFCLKKITSAMLPLQINGTERDCAPQKFETQNYKNGEWHAEVIIEEPYKEGCQKVDDKGLRTSHMENCYCKGDLCNTVEAIRGGWAMCGVAAVIVLMMSRFN